MQAVKQVYASLPPDQRAKTSVLTSNYGEAGVLSLLAEPSSLPPIISGHNNYCLWGPGSCTGDVLILVGYSQSDVQGVHDLFGSITPVATATCELCTDLGKSVPISVVSEPTRAIFPEQSPLVKHYD
jgi:hypothetical protein